MELKQHLEQLSTRTKLFESNWRVTKNIMDSQEIMLELMLEKYLTEVKIKRIQTKPKGIAQEIIIHITRATCILIGEFILLCRSNIRYTSNIEE